MNLWRKLPIALRAIIVGWFLSEVGHGVPAAFCFTNLRLWPRVPWSIPLVVFFLWIFWQYLGGRWWPASTSEARRGDLRGGPLASVVWRWALLAGGFWMSCVGALHVILLRIEATRYQEFRALFNTETPPLTLAAILVALSATAGVVEEASFRGYMQTPIEQRHGLLMAIVVPSILFVLAHFSPATLPMSFSRVFFILSAGVNYALLTHLSGSIRPAIVLHATGDALGGGMLWLFWTLSGPTSSRPMGLAAASHDPMFWLACVEALMLGAAAVWAYIQLGGAAGRVRPLMTTTDSMPATNPPRWAK